MDDQNVRAVLLDTITNNGQAQKLVLVHGQAALRAREARRLKAVQRVIDFDHYSGSAWYVLNKKYKSNSGSREYERAFDAQEAVAGMIKEIHNEAVVECSFGTKKSALETLRKIGKSIALAPSTVGSEVRKHFQWDPCFKDAMYEILELMTPDERLHMAESTDAQGRFLDKAIEIQAEFSSLCIMELDEVVQMLEDALGEDYSDDESGGESDPEVAEDEGDEEEREE